MFLTGPCNKILPSKEAYYIILVTKPVIIDFMFRNIEDIVFLLGQLIYFLSHDQTGNKTVMIMS